MSGWRKLPPVMGRAKPCACCGVMADYFAPESVIATGFGVAQLTRDGDRVYEYRDQESPMTGAEAEAMAAADPDHDWQIFVLNPTYDARYQRHGSGAWVLVEHGDGFA